MTYTNETQTTALLAAAIEWGFDEMVPPLSSRRWDPVCAEVGIPNYEGRIEMIAAVRKALKES